MTLNELTNESILVLGTGREGTAALSFLKKHFPDKKIDQTDQTDGPDYLRNLNNYQVIIKSPGIPYSPKLIAAKNNGSKITSITKIFFDNFPGKIVGVTGTKGKSTTAALIYQVLKVGGLDVYLVGNIGKPALEILDFANSETIAVYELSSFQLEDLEKSPQFAVITNIYQEHLDHHGDFESYQNAKANIARFQNEEDYLIFNQDEDLNKIVNLSKAKNKCPYTDQLPINYQPAKIVGKIFNISEDQIKQALSDFKTLPHRLEFVGEFNPSTGSGRGIRFYNDSLSTIPQATIRALKILEEDVQTLIVGGFDRGIDYSILGPAIVESAVKNLILFPTTGEKIWQSIVSHTPSGKAKIQKFHVNNMEEAVKIAYQQTEPGKIVLLSPASTSFNMFKDYADRGDQFKKYISKRK